MSRQKRRVGSATRGSTDSAANCGVPVTLFQCILAGALVHVAQSLPVEFVMDHLLSASQRIGDVSASDGSRIYIGISPSSGQDPHHQALSTLPVASQAAFDSASKQDDPLCLPETRQEVLRKIRDWVYGDDMSHIFWLNGMAGTGKSTIARTLARELSDKGDLGASFFFIRGGGDVAHAKLFFTTIARQLGRKFQAAGETIAKSLRKDEDIVNKMRVDQWKKLIVEPLNAVQGEHSRVCVVVIDALDECDNDNDIVGIISVFAKSSEIHSIKLRIIVTSRPETAIRTEFKRPEIVHQKLILHDQPRKIVNADIRRYYLDSFDKIRSQREWLAKDWPGADAMDQLVALADTLFIFAATVCRFVAESIDSTDDVVDVFLQDQSQRSLKHYKAGQSTAHLDRMYAIILGSFVRGLSQSEKISSLEEILGAIAGLSEPLTVKALAALLVLSEKTIVQCLARLHSVVRVPSAANDHIRLFHASFRDFLLDPQRCSAISVVDGKPVDVPVSFESNATHDTLASACLILLSERLCEDVCNVNDPGSDRVRITPEVAAKKITAELCYACRYWVHHVEKSQEQVVDGGLVHKFLKVFFLHWIEALAWLGQAAESVALISTLITLAKTNSDVAEFLMDAKRFVLWHMAIIDQAPLQLYRSAIAFSPIKSLIRQTFEQERASEISWIPEPPETWDPELFRYDVSVPSRLAFSTDSQLLASASQDGTLHVWDLSTGKKIFENYAERVGRGGEIAISLDGRICTSDRKMIKVLDIAAGDVVYEIQLDASGPTALAPDAQSVAWTTSDGNIQHLSMRDHHSTQHTKTLHADGEVNAISISPNGLRLALVMTDKRINILSLGQGGKGPDIKSFTKQPPAFSGTGHLIAFRSGTRSLCVWNVTAGQEKHRFCIFERDELLTGPIAFSADDRRLAAGSSTGTIRLWDIRTGEQISAIKAHKEVLLDLKLSPDGEFLASASYDNTVRVWSTSSNAKDEGYQDSDRFNWIDMSPNGQFVLALVPAQTKIQVWDVETRQEVFSRILETFYSEPCFSTSGTITYSLSTTIATIDLPQDIAEAIAASPGNPTRHYSRHSDVTLLNGWVRDDEDGLPFEYIDNWLVFGGRKLLLIPPDQKPSVVSCQGRRAVMLTSFRGICTVEVGF